MKCGLQSKVAGVKFRWSNDIEVIIQKSSMAPQYESPGRDKLGWECARAGSWLDVALR